MADGVSSHLGIPLAEYDSRIRTFVPFYEEMLEVVQHTVAALAPVRPTVLDLGTGTGAVAERCLRARPEARLIGLDADAEILRLAAERLASARELTLLHRSVTDRPLPGADVIVSSLALHHLGDERLKRAVYAACRAALDDGFLLLADCFPPAPEALVRAGMDRWHDHLERSYSRAEAAAHLAAWAEEDTYVPLATELAWLADARFRTEVVWRRELFAVVLCR